MSHGRYNSRFERHWNTTLRVLAVVFLGLWTETAVAQLPATLSDSARVSLITILPGDPVYSAFGHTAILFREPSVDFDIVFNFGTFDSEDPLFIPKFTYGKLDYILSVNSLQGLLALSELEKRAVIEQRLRLSNSQRADLYVRLLENARPENRIYRYDFVWENCSTKVLDVIRDVMGEGLTFDTTSVSPIPFRELIRPYIVARPVLHLGIDIALGSGMDGQAEYFERTFLPLELFNALDQATVRVVADPDSLVTDGQTVPMPLVSRKDTLLWYDGSHRQDAGFPWPTILVWAVLAGWVLVDIRRPKSEQLRPLCDRIFLGILGVAGLIVFFLWFVSEHTLTTANWNLAWALPTHLWPAIFWSRMTTSHKRVYFASVGLLAVALLLAQTVLIQTLNPALVPIVIMVAWRSFMIARSTRPATI